MQTKAGYILYKIFVDLNKEKTANLKKLYDYTYK